MKLKKNSAKWHIRNAIKFIMVLNCAYVMRRQLLPLFCIKSLITTDRPYLHKMSQKTYRICVRGCLFLVSFLLTRLVNTAYELDNSNELVFCKERLAYTPTPHQNSICFSLIYKTMNFVLFLP